MRVLGTSHGGRYEYFTENDLEVFQRDIVSKTVEWLCSMSAWERTFSQAKWVTLTKEV